MRDAREGDRVIGILAAILRAIGYVELSISVLLVFFISVAIGASVVFRYLLSSPLIFVEEASTIAFIWTTLLGAAVAAKMDRHITILSFEGYLSPRGKTILAVVVRALVLVVATLVAVFCLEFVGMQNRSNTVSLPINVPRGWVFSIPTMLAMTSIAATQAVLLLDAVTRLRQPAGTQAPVRIMEPLPALEI